MMVDSYDEREIDELRELMRSHGLLRPVPEPLAADAAAEERLLAMILRSPRAPRPGLRAVLSLSVAAVLLLFVVLVGSGLSTSSPATASTPRQLEYSAADPAQVDRAPSATSTLQGLARTAASSPASEAGEVQYVAMYGWLLDVSASAGALEAVVHPTATEQWLAPDGAVRVDQRRARALTVEGHLDTDAEAGTERATDTAPPGTLDPELASGLPTAVDSLQHSLLALQPPVCENSAQERTSCVVRAIESLYARYVVSPGLAASMWRVLAAQEGVKDFWSTADRIGRPVRAVAVADATSSDSAIVTVLLIDESTGLLVGTETITLHDSALGLDEPTVTGFTTWTTVRYVAAVGDKN